MWTAPIKTRSMPMRWEETVMPKYRLCGARITRGANFKLLTLGMLLVLIGAVLIATDQFNGGASAAGVVFAIIGLALLFTPLCLVYYVTELQVICDPDDAAASSWTQPGAAAKGYVSYYLRTFQKPDDDFIL